MPLAAARVFARRNMPACPPAAFRLLPAARGRTENDACLWRVAMSIANRGGLTRSDSFLRFLSGTSEAIMLPI
ncbi:hypothetical protein BOC43_16045 [Burkholderia pseudomallei]|nr:hypothetical protein BOC43_16045 [Burkholderia pseudomallei]